MTDQAPTPVEMTDEELEDQFVDELTTLKIGARSVPAFYALMPAPRPIHVRSLAVADLENWGK